MIDEISDAPILNEWGYVHATVTLTLDAEEAEWFATNLPASDECTKQFAVLAARMRDESLP